GPEPRDIEVRIAGSTARQDIYWCQSLRRCNGDGSALWHSSEPTLPVSAAKVPDGTPKNSHPPAIATSRGRERGYSRLVPRLNSLPNSTLPAAVSEAISARLRSGGTGPYNGSRPLHRYRRGKLPHCHPLPLHPS